MNADFAYREWSRWGSEKSQGEIAVIAPIERASRSTEGRETVTLCSARIQCRTRCQRQVDGSFVPGPVATSLTPAA